MKVRTPLELTTRLQSDLAWRRKEVQFYKNWASRAGNQQAVLRGGVAVLYAHWEGFVKTAAQAFLEYVSTRGMPYSMLKPCFLAITAKSRMAKATASFKSRESNELIDFLEIQWAQSSSSIPTAGVISTQANLTVAVFRNILDTLGLDYLPDYTLREKVIVERLLELRNGIAHGEYQTIDPQEYEQLYREVDFLLVTFANQVDNAASTQAYCRTIATPSVLPVPVAPAQP